MFTRETTDFTCFYMFLQPDFGSFEEARCNLGYAVAERCKATGGNRIGQFHGPSLVVCFFHLFKMQPEASSRANCFKPTQSFMGISLRPVPKEAQINFVKSHSLHFDHFLYKKPPTKNPKQKPPTKKHQQNHPQNPQNPQPLRIHRQLDPFALPSHHRWQRLAAWRFLLRAGGFPKKL